MPQRIQMIKLILGHLYINIEVLCFWVYTVKEGETSNPLDFVGRKSTHYNNLSTCKSISISLFKLYLNIVGTNKEFIIEIHSDLNKL